MLAGRVLYLVCIPLVFVEVVIKDGLKHSESRSLFELERYKIANLSDACFGNDDDLNCEFLTQSNTINKKPNVITSNPAAEKGENDRDPLISLTSSGCKAHSIHPASSILYRGDMANIPGKQKWSSCKYCGLEGVTGPNNFNILQGVLFDPLGDLQSDNSEKLVVLSESRWGVFFGNSDTHSNPWSRILGKIIDEKFGDSICSRFIEKPTVVFHMLTWHVGHLIIDVLEPLYQMLRGKEMSFFSKSRGFDMNDEIDLREILIVLDIDAEMQRPHLHLDILRDVYSDTPFSLLRAFTKYPIHTMGSLAKLNGISCFKELHFGLDLTNTYYAYGQSRHPSVLDPANNKDDNLLKTKFLEFSTFLRHAAIQPALVDKPMHEDVAKLIEPNHITFIMRDGPRSISNMNELVLAAEQMCTVQMKGKCIVYKANLGKLSLSKQAELFSKTRVLVGQYGTGLHNIPLVSQGGAELVLMMPGWCPFAWQMVNQALAGGLHALALCHEVEPPKTERKWHRLSWSRRSWLQGPYGSKEASYSVPTEEFKNLLLKALDLTNAAFGAEQPQYTVQIIRTGQNGLLSEDVPDEFPLLAFVHIAAVENILRSDGWVILKIKMEVICNFEPEEVLSQAELCLQAGKLENSFICFRADLLSEHTTIDVQVPPDKVQRGLLTLKGWLTNDGITMPDSETFASVLLPNKFSLPVGIPGQMWNKGGHGGHLTTSIRSRLIIVQVTIFGDTADENRIYRLEMDISDDMGLQRTVTDFCRKHKLDFQVCVTLSESMSSYAAVESEAANLGLPPIQDLPNSKHPFIFLHLEKCGGSSTRNIIVQAAYLKSLKSFVPCFEGYRYSSDSMNCVQFDLSDVPIEDRPGLEVIALHPRNGWNFWKELPSVVSEEDFQCFFMMRHPVERVISYYYERVVEYGNPSSVHINSLSIEELKKIMKNFYGTKAKSSRSIYIDEGLSDAGCKLLSGTYAHMGKDTAEILETDAMYSYQIAANRLDKCVVGILEQWEDTKKVLSRWIPWMEYYSDNIEYKNRYTEQKETLHSLRPELRVTIEQFNKCDMDLYTHALDIFQKQMDIIEMSGYYASLGYMPAPIPRFRFKKIVQL